MTSKIEILWKHALTTFSGRHNSGYKLCQRNFDKLRALINEITAEDVSVDKNVLDFVENQRAPMCVIPIFEDEDITIVVFILKHGTTLPMHDHPGMHGLLKVLSGVLKVDSFTTLIPQGRIVQIDEEVTALRYPCQIIQKTDPACVLTPVDHNTHEIGCLKGPAAFLDILSPPYDVDYDERERSLRPCTFFRQISEEQMKNPADGAPIKVRLRAVKQPPLLYSINLKYLGPPLR